jgi:hypothetical protein
VPRPEQLQRAGNSRHIQLMICFEKSMIATLHWKGAHSVCCRATAWSGDGALDASNMMPCASLTSRSDTVMYLQMIENMQGSVKSMLPHHRRHRRLHTPRRHRSARLGSSRRLRGPLHRHRLLVLSLRHPAYPQRQLNQALMSSHQPLQASYQAVTTSCTGLFEGCLLHIAIDIM